MALQITDIIMGTMEEDMGIIVITITIKGKEDMNMVEEMIVKEDVWRHVWHVAQLYVVVVVSVIFSRDFTLDHLYFKYT